MAFKWDESNGVSNGPTALHLCTDPGDLGVSKYSGSTCLFGRSRRAESKINRDLANAQTFGKIYERPVGRWPSTLMAKSTLCIRCQEPKSPEAVFLQ